MFAKQFLQPRQSCAHDTCHACQCHTLDTPLMLLMVIIKEVSTSASHNVRGFCTKNVALRERNSGAESGRELFKGSKDLAHLLVCTRKNFFGWEVWIFCE